MSGPLVIALDAMGGDRAPEIVLKGANLAGRRFPDVEFRLFGNEAAMTPFLRRLPKLRKRCTIHHTESVVRNDDKPSVALRQGRGSSMQLAINAVRDGEAAGVVSAGNTGALMAMAKISLRTLPGIDRPAIAAYYPTLPGESVMLDLGANVECDSQNLFQFAVLGSAFARLVLGVQNPKVGLLNVGTEEPKGNESVKQAAAMLRTATDLPMEFIGFVEGDDITRGTVDVIVTDGFTGNIALKTAEGTVRLYGEFLRRAFKSSIASKLGYLLARRALKKLRARIDPRRYNGAVFLGLNGVVVKSHGGTDAFGFANAVGVAIDMARNGCNDVITRELANYTAGRPLPAQAVAS
ncbi:MAG: phosphate acyltransferase PlsX [Rhodospirillales bacterium]